MDRSTELKSPLSIDRHCAVIVVDSGTGHALDTVFRHSNVDEIKDIAVFPTLDIRFGI